MIRREDPKARCDGCRASTPASDRVMIGSSAYCSRCARPDPGYRYGRSTDAPSRRREEAAADLWVPDAEDIDRLRRAGQEFHRANEASAQAHRLAVHEAGHAVLGYALGIPLRRVEIDVHDAAGFTERGNGGPTWTVHDAAAWLYGGEVAEEQRFGVSRGATDDEEVLRDLAAVATHGVLDQARAYARDAVAQNWAAVEALAAALIRRAVLDSYDVEAVLAPRMRVNGHGLRAAADLPEHPGGVLPRGWEPPDGVPVVDGVLFRVWRARRAATERGEVWDAAAETRTLAAIADERRTGVIRDYGWSGLQ